MIYKEPEDGERDDPDRGTPHKRGRKDLKLKEEKKGATTTGGDKAS